MSADQKESAASGGTEGLDDRDSPKRQGDKLGAGTSAVPGASETGRTGDSPKRQGDKLRHAVDEAAKG